MPLLNRLKTIFRPSSRVRTFLQKLKEMLGNVNVILRNQNHILLRLAKDEINYRLNDPVSTFPHLRSQLCTFEQMNSAAYLHWCKESNYATGMVKNRKKGCRILATDLDLATAKQKGWVGGQVQHAQKLQDLNQCNLCNQAVFNQNVAFRVVNMNDISPDLQGWFDFLWSSCSLEHLGSIEARIRFILNAMKCLKPGGVAVL